MDHDHYLFSISKDFRDEYYEFLESIKTQNGVLKIEPREVIKNEFKKHNFIFGYACKKFEIGNISYIIFMEVFPSIKKNFLDASVKVFENNRLAIQEEYSQNFTPKPKKLKLNWYWDGIESPDLWGILSELFFQTTKENSKI